MSKHKAPQQDQMSRAFQLFHAGNFPAAERACKEMLRADPAHADANNCLGLIQQRLGRQQQAISLFEKVLSTHPGYIPAYGNLANSLSQLGRIDDAKRLVARALELRPAQAIANRALGDLGCQAMEYAKAEAFYRRALAAEPDDGHSHAGLGNALRRLDRLEEALACYDDAMRLQPGNAIVHLNRGNILSDMGRIDAAIDSYRTAIRLKPDHARTHQLLAAIRTHTDYDAELEAMQALYGRADIPTEDRMNLAFGLGKAFEDLEQFDKAFEFLQQGNKLRRSLVPYSIADDVALFERLESTFDQDFFSQRAGLGREDNTPIFILGMPRSGTSLVEQILASHPQVHGAGELADMEMICRSAVEKFPDQVTGLQPGAWEDLAADYLERLHTHDTSAAYVTDKMPQNFLYVGMIAVMLPNAKIIHCRRDPMDTCLSLYKSLFFSAGHQWCYDIEDLGRYYQLYQGLMEHWHRVLPGRIYDLQYEDLVADSEPQIRGLLDDCELPFDSACLSFHESKRAVQTLSFAQVRKPIYSSSVQLWKRYEKHLQPLVSRLGGAR